MNSAVCGPPNGLDKWEEVYDQCKEGQTPQWCPICQKTVINTCGVDTHGTLSCGHQNGARLTQDGSILSPVLWTDLTQEDLV
jgi:hypothetical protein